MRFSLLFVSFAVIIPPLVAGCRSTSDPATGDPEVDLAHADPRVRIQASFQVVTEDREDLYPQLIHNLRDRDGAVRLFTSIALRKLSGEDFGYRAYGTLGEREVAIRLWEDWWQTKNRGLPVRSEDPTDAAASPESTNGEPPDDELRGQF